VINDFKDQIKASEAALQAGSTKTDGAPTAEEIAAREKRAMSLRLAA
jgi:hypothetical protein